jgi:beta-glucosidase
MYVKRPDAEGDRPIKELRGFARITLQPDETKTVHFPFKEPGRVRIMVGSSSADVRLETTIEVK